MSPEPGADQMWKLLVELKGCVAGLKTDMEWVKRTYWLIAGASVGSLVASLISAAVRFR